MVGALRTAGGAAPRGTAPGAAAAPAADAAAAMVRMRTLIECLSGGCTLFLGLPFVTCSMDTDGDCTVPALRHGFARGRAAGSKVEHGARQVEHHDQNPDGRQVGRPRFEGRGGYADR